MMSACMQGRSSVAINVPGRRAHEPRDRVNGHQWSSVIISGHQRTWNTVEWRLRCRSRVIEGPRCAPLRHAALAADTRARRGTGARACDRQSPRGANNEPDRTQSACNQQGRITNLIGHNQHAISSVRARMRPAVSSRGTNDEPASARPPAATSATPPHPAGARAVGSTRSSAGCSTRGVRHEKPARPHTSLVRIWRHRASLALPMYSALASAVRAAVVARAAAARAAVVRAAVVRAAVVRAAVAGAR